MISPEEICNDIQLSSPPKNLEQALTFKVFWVITTKLDGAGPVDNSPPPTSSRTLSEKNKNKIKIQVTCDT